MKRKLVATIWIFISVILAVDPIVIYDGTPIYPIQRSGTLANLLLPKSYLTIWDFIG